MNDRRLITEHDTFKTMTDSLDLASACAKRMMELRPDQSRPWEMLAKTFEVSSKAVWKLAEEAATRSILKP